MSEVKVCRRCGSQIAGTDRFCGECGFDTLETAAVKPPAEARPPAAPCHPPLGRSTANKHALIIMTAVLVMVFLGGGGLCWWLSRGEGSTVSGAGEKAGQTAVSSSPAAKTPDLSQAATYLPEPGLKYTFFVNYPDGMSGIVERFSARVSPGRTVRISEVETGVERGEAFGHGAHYIERLDGTYYILDQTPQEIVPVLKNNLTVGQTWSYRSEFGQITWTVLDMGVDLDVGFTTFKNCLLVQEDNQPTAFQSITYYAPGRGSVLVRDLAGSVDYYKVTALTRIEEAQAAETVIRWSPNYKQIKDDRTRS